MRGRRPFSPISVHRFRDALRCDYMERRLAQSSFLRLDQVCRRLTDIQIRSTADIAGMDDDDVDRFLEGQPDALNLRKALEVAYRRGYKMGLVLSPQKFSKTPRRLDTEPAASPSMADMEKLLSRQSQAAAQSWTDYRGYALTATGAFTGLHIRELRDLLVTDLDLEAGKIEVRRREGMKERPGFRHRVDIPRQLHPILAKWKTFVVGDWLFPGNNQRGPWDRNPRTPGSANRPATRASTRWPRIPSSPFAGSSSPTWNPCSGSRRPSQAVLPGVVRHAAG